MQRGNTAGQFRTESCLMITGICGVIKLNWGYADYPWHSDTPCQRVSMIRTWPQLSPLQHVEKVITAGNQQLGLSCSAGDSLITEKLGLLCSSLGLELNTQCAQDSWILFCPCIWTWKVLAALYIHFIIHYPSRSEFKTHAILKSPCGTPHHDSIILNQKDMMWL